MEQLFKNKKQLIMNTYNKIDLTNPILRFQFSKLKNFNNYFLKVIPIRKKFKTKDYQKFMKKLYNYGALS